VFFSALLHVISAGLGTVEAVVSDQWSVMTCQEDGAMRERERTLARRKLDEEMQPFRRAGMAKNPTNGLLRAVRQALRIPMAEIERKMGVCRSVVFDLETRELKNTTTLRSMSRMAEAMGCKVVYGIVPMGGKKLEEVAMERLWAAAVGRTVDSGQ